MMARFSSAFPEAKSYQSAITRAIVIPQSETAVRHDKVRTLHSVGWNSSSVEKNRIACDDRGDADWLPFRQCSGNVLPLAMWQGDA